MRRNGRKVFTFGKPFSKTVPGLNGTVKVWPSQDSEAIFVESQYEAWGPSDSALLTPEQAIAAGSKLIQLGLATLKRRRA